MDLKPVIKSFILSQGEDNINQAISSLTNLMKDQESADLKIRFLVELHNQPKKDTPTVTQYIYTRDTDKDRWQLSTNPEYDKKPLWEIFKEHEENIPFEARMLLKTIFPMIAKAFKNKDGGYIKILIYNELKEIDEKEVLQTILQVNTFDCEDCNTAIDKYTFSRFLEMIIGK